MTTAELLCPWAHYCTFRLPTFCECERMCIRQLSCTGLRSCLCWMKEASLKVAGAVLWGKWGLVLLIPDTLQ